MNCGTPKVTWVLEAVVFDLISYHTETTSSLKRTKIFTINFHLDINGALRGKNIYLVNECLYEKT